MDAEELALGRRKPAAQNVHCEAPSADHWLPRGGRLEHGWHACSSAPPIVSLYVPAAAKADVVISQREEHTLHSGAKGGYE